MSSERDKEVLWALGQKYSPEILEATSDPTTAQEIIEDLGIPPATCYRRLEALIEVGLLEEKKPERNVNAREVPFYQRTIDAVYFNFDDHFSTTTKESSQLKRKLDRLWRGVLDYI